MGKGIPKTSGSSANLGFEFRVCRFCLAADSWSARTPIVGRAIPTTRRDLHPDLCLSRQSETTSDVGNTLANGPALPGQLFDSAQSPDSLCLLAENNSDGKRRAVSELSLAV